MKNSTKKIKVKFYESDAGFCRDTFVTVGDKKKMYFNRCTEHGLWYHTDPYGGCFEHSHLVAGNIIFEIMENNRAVALDGNGEISGKKPFISERERNREARKLFLDHMAAKGIDTYSYEEMKQMLISQPAYGEYSGYEENWIHHNLVPVSITKVVTADVYGKTSDFLAVEFVHSCGVAYISYHVTFNPKKKYSLTFESRCELHPLLLYTWEPIGVKEEF